ncbi:hypothetical protein BGX38DRAFT_1280499 [Terfezia claveryi]|nr:hypothetical protein BGX38DRAFT_1280499 [Terfezia claveryi]
MLKVASPTLQIALQRRLLTLPLQRLVTYTKKHDELHKTWCHWCPQLYASPGAYANHLAKIHPEEKLFKSRKRRLSDISHTSSSSAELEIANIGEIFLTSNDCSDREGESEGSDKKLGTIAVMQNPQNPTEKASNQKH